MDTEVYINNRLEYVLRNNKRNKRKISYIVF